MAPHQEIYCRAQAEQYLGLAMTNSGGFFPTEEQELLLRAAIVRGEGAGQAWRDWQARVDLDTIDAGGMRLLPLIYLNLSGQGILDPAMNRLKGVHRSMWYRNQLYFSRMEPTLADLHGAGVRIMLLKGAALVHNYYKDLGARPMNDLDILVSPAQLAAAIKVLVGAGWREKKILPIYNSRTFLDPENHELDLHWHVLHECLTDNADSSFWKYASSAHFGGVETLIPSPTDLLFHVCVHGMRWNYIPPLRWIADAMTILNVAGDGLDWERIVSEAKERQLILVIREAFCYLRDKMNAVIPRAVIQELTALELSPIEKMDYAARRQPNEFLGLKSYWVSYQRLACANGFKHRKFGWIEFFQRAWDLEHGWQVPIVALRRFFIALRTR
jgi:hypothetical protein